LWQVLNYFDTRLRQHLFGTDARNEQDMRTRNSTTTYDDLAVSLDTIFGGYRRLGHLDANSTGFWTRFIEQDTFDYSTDSNREVGTLEDTRWQISNGNRVSWVSISDVRDK